MAQRVLLSGELSIASWFEIIILCMLLNNDHQFLTLDYLLRPNYLPYTRGIKRALKSKETCYTSSRNFVSRTGLSLFFCPANEGGGARRSSK